MKFIFLSIFTFLISLNLYSATQFEFLPDRGAVEFKTKGWPNLVNIKGKGKGLSGTLNLNDNKLSGLVSFNLSTLDTGISLRDEHMKNNYLQVSQFPNAELVLTELPIPKEMKGSFDFKGQLKLHGITKEISGKATLNNKENQMELSAEIPLLLTDFKIEIPSYQGITVADKVSIMIDTKINKKE